MKKFLSYVFFFIIILSSVCFATEGSTYFYVDESGDLVQTDDLSMLGDVQEIENEEDYYNLYNEYSNNGNNQEEAKAGFNEQLSYLIELQDAEAYEKYTVANVISDITTEYSADNYYGYYFAIKYQTAIVRDNDGNEYESVIILSYDVMDNNNIKALKAGDTFYGYRDIVSSSNDSYNLVNHGLNDSEIAYMYISEQDRSLGVILLAALTIILLLLYAGKDGLKLLIPIFVAVDLLFVVFVPYIEMGKNILLLAILIAIEFIILICVLKNGWKKKTFCAILASAIVVTLTASLAWFFVYTNRISGEGIISENGSVNVYYVQYMFNEKIDASVFYISMVILLTSVVSATIASKLAGLIERYSGSKEMVDNIINEAKTMIGEYPLIIAIIFSVLALPKFMALVFDQTNIIQILNSDTMITYLSLMLFTIGSSMIVAPLLAIVGNIFMGDVEVKQISNK